MPENTIGQTGLTENELQQEIINAVGGEQRMPLFYALTGSQLYGFENEESDVDVNGFHISTKSWASLDQPQNVIHITDMDGIDITSHELRHFGQQLARRNIHEMEVIFNAPVIHSAARAQVLEIRRRARERLPGDLPSSYGRMGRGIYYRETEDPPNPTAKMLLYSLRAVLAARYVAEHNDVVANIMPLTQVKEGSRNIAAELVAWRQHSPGQPAEGNLYEKATSLIEEIIEEDDHDEMDSSIDYERWRNEIDEWMSAVRILNTGGS